MLNEVKNLSSITKRLNDPFASLRAGSLVVRFAQDDKRGVLCLFSVIDTNRPTQN